MRHIIINGENIINFEDIYYYGEKLNNNCGDKLIYCLMYVITAQNGVILTLAYIFFLLILGMGTRKDCK